MLKKKSLMILSLCCLVIICVFFAFTQYTIALQEERAINYNADVSENNESKEVRKRRIAVNKLLGWGFEFDSKRRHWSVQNGKKIFDATLSIDHFGRRVIPIENLNKRSKFLLFIGGSYVLSDTVNDNETYAYHIAKKLKNFSPYVYGGWWYAPTQHLRRFRNFPLKEEIPQEEGIALLLFNTSHARGILGDICFNVHDSNINAPKYSLTNKRLKYQGTFNESELLQSTLIKVLPRTFKASLMNHCWKRMLKDQFGVYGVKDTLDEDEMMLIITVFKELEKVIKESFPKSKLVVLLHFFGHKFLTDLYNKSKEEQIEIYKLDGNTLIDYEYPKSYHYSPKGEKVMSELILDILVKNNILDI